MEISTPGLAKSRAFPPPKLRLIVSPGHGNFPSADSAIFTPEKIGTQGVNLQAQRAINRQFHRIR